MAEPHRPQVIHHNVAQTKFDLQTLMQKVFHFFTEWVLILGLQYRIQTTMYNKLMWQPKTVIWQTGNMCWFFVSKVKIGWGWGKMCLLQHVLTFLFALHMSICLREYAQNDTEFCVCKTQKRIRTIQSKWINQDAKPCMHHTVTCTVLYEVKYHKLYSACDTH